MRQSRAGRQHTMFMIIMRHESKYPTGSLTTAQIARKMGLKSSTYLKNILRHMVEIGLINAVKIQPFYDCGYTVDAWQFCRYEQTPLPDHQIIVNGKSCRMSDTDAVEYLFT